jgi:hypothetical protein
MFQPRGRAVPRGWFPPLGRDLAPPESREPLPRFEGGAAERDGPDGLAGAADGPGLEGLASGARRSTAGGRYDRGASPPRGAGRYEGGGLSSPRPGRGMALGAPYDASGRPGRSDPGERRMIVSDCGPGAPGDGTGR